MEGTRRGCGDTLCFLERILRFDLSGSDCQTLWTIIVPWGVFKYLGSVFQPWVMSLASSSGDSDIWKPVGSP